MNDFKNAVKDFSVKFYDEFSEAKEPRIYFNINGLQVMDHIKVCNFGHFHRYEIELEYTLDDLDIDLPASCKDMTDKDIDSCLTEMLDDYLKEHPQTAIELEKFFFNEWADELKFSIEHGAKKREIKAFNYLINNRAVYEVIVKSTNKTDTHILQFDDDDVSLELLMESILKKVGI